MQKHGDTVAGRKIELLVRDDTGSLPRPTSGLAQEAIARDKVAIIAGFGLTPLAFATAPVATEAKIPMIVIGRGDLRHPAALAVIVRSNFTVPQITAPMADWAAKKGMKRLFTMVTDYAPGIECENVFVKRFTAPAQACSESIRTPLAQSGLRPVHPAHQRRAARGAVPLVPSGEHRGMKQYLDRGLREAASR